MKVLVSGGNGFIGSNYVIKTLGEMPSCHIVNIDKGTYAARPEHLKAHLRANCWGNRYTEYNTDICDSVKINEIMILEKPDIIVHFAAESHVCNSIRGPGAFYKTNAMGTFNMVEAMRRYCPDSLFVHISTDEIFGEALNGPFNEDSPIAPRSPYAASKAASDQVVIAHAKTYGLRCVVTNCSNNYGPNQHNEKLIPHVVSSALLGKPINVFMPGTQIRDWIYVGDHCDAINTIINAIKINPGHPQRFCIGGANGMKNIDVIDYVLDKMFHMELIKPRTVEKKLVDGRPTDDQVYLVSHERLTLASSWSPRMCFRDGIVETIKYYDDYYRMKGLL